MKEGKRDSDMRFECDMHTHTVRSDGHLTPIQSIDRAVELGLKAIVICDHDITPVLFWEGINLEEYAASKGLEFISGTEISCDTDNEDVHLIGIFCDWEAPEFVELEKQIQMSRMNGYRKMLDKMADAGFQVSWEDALEAAGRVKDPENIYKKQIYEYIAKKGYADDWKEAKILLKSRPEFDPNREKPDPVDMIQMIHKTGGKVIMAHPFLVQDEPCYKGKKMSRFEYIDMLIESGLDGIEVCYPYEKTSYTGNLTSEEIWKQVRERYGNGKVFLSGGSDFHGDFVKGVSNPRELGECGISYEYYCKHIARREAYR